MDLDKYKIKLEEELVELEEELKSVGRINPSNSKDWEATPQKINVNSADLNEVADVQEGYNENSSILNELEIRFNEVKNALQRITDGKYGNCEICGKEIEEERLEVNPAATTCLEHL